MLLRREQIVPVVDLVDVDLAQLFHVLEHQVRQDDTFARIFQRLCMILVLAQNGTELQLELALLVDPAVPHRDLRTSVEFWLADERNALLEVEDALVEHAELLETHRHIVVRDERDVAVSRAAFQADDLQNGKSKGSVMIVKQQQRMNFASKTDGLSE